MRRALVATATAMANAARPEVPGAAWGSWGAGGLAARLLSTAAPDSASQLSDPKLLRTQCYVGGGWIDAASGEVIEVRREQMRRRQRKGGAA